MNYRLMLAATGLLLALTASVSAQFEQDPIDAGAADSVLMVFTKLPDATTNKTELEAELYLFNDGQNLSNAVLGFNWDNPSLEMDTAYWTLESLLTWNFLRILYRNDDIDSTNLYREFTMLGGRITGAGWIARTEPGHVSTYHWDIPDWDVMSEIVIDSQTVLGANFVFVDASTNEEYTPYWAGPYVIRDTARPETSNLILSEDTLYYSAIQGQGNPPSQQFSIDSDNLPLAFDLVETASWLLKSPSSGVTPEDVEVSITTTGLTQGVYFDSIEVQSAAATNSPQYLYVSLGVAPPPPEIGVDPPSFTFNALAGGSNPLPQTLDISNLGGTTLNWSVSNSESWLTLAPLSGTDAGQVTLTVDITGLSFGTYNDIITVSDPAASNDPVEVPVLLSIASDLPLIEVEEPVMYLPVDASGEYTFTREFEVLNGGGGSLAFTVEPVTGGTVFDIDPTSATAPATIEVTFKFTQWVDAYEIDTVYVVSPDALNSPYPVIFHQRVVFDPAEIALSTDTVELTVYDCSQGYGNELPSVAFDVTNAGGDDPMLVECEYESELFHIATPVEPAPATVIVEALETDAPLGNYLDSIRVSARWAENKPQWVFVKYNKIAGTNPPEIITVPSTITVAWQEDSGPALFEGPEIWNVEGGCMSWEIDESLAWLSASTGSGDVPGLASFLIDPTGYTLGEYPGSFDVTSAGATNSPYTVGAVLQVWKLHGDFNWNGAITIQDIAMMISYLFAGGVPPQPTVEVADCNCDDEVTIGDVSAMIDYLFVSLEPLCGNPY